MVKLLLAAGAPINDTTKCFRYGGLATPLCNAVWAGKTDVVEFLLKNGAATNVVGGKFVRSITEYAEKYADRKIVELLSKYGGNPHLSDWPGVQLVRNKLPALLASGEFKLPADIKVK